MTQLLYRGKILRTRGSLSLSIDRCYTNTYTYTLDRSIDVIHIHIHMPFTKFLAANGGGSSVTAFLLFHIPLVSRLDRLDSVVSFLSKSLFLLESFVKYTNF